MERQEEIISAIATLAGSIDPLVRAEAKEAVTLVVAKLLELVTKL